VGSDLRAHVFELAVEPLKRRTQRAWAPHLAR
jgi:hypothetical protein